MQILDQVVTAIREGRGQQLVDSARSSQQSAQNAKLLPREDILDLWELMGRMYGHRWTSQFGDAIDPGNVWAASLKGISPAQLRAGVAACVAQGLDWPPSAPEFRKLCLGGPTLDKDGNDIAGQHSWMLRAEAEYQKERGPLLALEDQTAKAERKARGRERMAQIRAEVGI